MPAFLFCFVALYWQSAWRTLKFILLMLICTELLEYFGVIQTGLLIW